MVILHVAKSLFQRSCIGLNKFFVKTKLCRKREPYYEINEISASER